MKHNVNNSYAFIMFYGATCMFLLLMMFSNNMGFYFLATIILGISFGSFIFGCLFAIEYIRILYKNIRQVKEDGTRDKF